MPQIAITCQHQQQTHWCWAAVVASVNNYYAAKSSTRQPITQQELADRYVGGHNQQFDPFQALQDLHLSNGTDDGMIDWDALEKTVKDGEPNIARVGGPRSGHYILVIGYQAGTTRTRRYIILDPDETNPAPRTLSQAKLETYGGGYDGTQYTRDQQVPQNHAVGQGQDEISVP